MVFLQILNARPGMCRLEGHRPFSFFRRVGQRGLRAPVSGAEWWRVVWSVELPQKAGQALWRHTLSQLLRTFAHHFMLIRASLHT